MTHTHGLTTFCFIVAASAVIWYHLLYECSRLLSKPKHLSVMILSSPSSLRNRQRQRKWLKQYGTDELLRVEARFVIGSRSCSIHPQYRVSQFDCQLLNISSVNTVLLNQDKLGTLSQDPVITEPNLPRKLCNGDHSFSFKTLFDVKLRGFLSTSHPSNTTNLPLISLVDRLSEETVLSVELESRKDDSNSVSVTPTLPITLHKGFEGEVMLENCDDKHRIHPMQNPVLDFDTSCPTNVGIEFELIDSFVLRDWLDSYPALSADWLAVAANERDALLREADEYGDIVFVDHLDVYRQLPHKLLLALQHEREFIGSEFVMKADDDTTIDLLRLLKLTESLQSNRLQILANFRANWNVYSTGKWAEPNFNSVTYPPFPCGSGYILSKSLSQWFTENSHHLKRYQGEDVSMGIWASATMAELIQTDLFCCQAPCRNDSITSTPD